MDAPHTQSATRSSSPIKTYFIVILLIIAGIAVFVAYIDALFQAPLTQAGAQIGSSAWALVAFFDASFGAVFPVYYLFVRNGPDVLCIPSGVYAFVWPLAANFALLWYVAFMIVRGGELSSALLPRSQRDDAHDAVWMRTQQNRASNGVAIALGAAAVAAVCALWVWAMGRESMRMALDVLISKQYKWITFTFVDSLAGLLFVAVYIVEREGGATMTSTLWVVALFAIGNLVTFAYVILMALDALQLDIPFSRAVLSRKTSLLPARTNAHV